MTTYRKKLIEVALPLDAINAESAREKSIRHGHPSTLHLWWARRPLAACRAVLFASLVDDPAEPAAPQPYLAALDALPKPDLPPAGWDDLGLAEQRRERLFAFIARLVKWEASNDERVLGTARELIRLACEGTPPPVLDPFCGGGSIPLEAQRLGLEAHASDLNPVAVLITKALIEIPPKFAGKPPVNPESRGAQPDAAAPPPARVGAYSSARPGAPYATGPSAAPARPGAPHDRGAVAGRMNPPLPVGWKGAAGLAADVRYYGRWMRDEAERRIGHLYPKAKLPDGGEATVIAWLWARTVRCPNPACGARMPLVRSFALSTKAGKQAWVEPQVDRDVTPPAVRFSVKTGSGTVPVGTVERRGARCVACDTSVPLEYVRSESRAGHMDAQMMAIVAEGQRSRIYLSPSEGQAEIAASAEPWWKPEGEIADNPGHTNVYRYGLTTWGSLFTSRQLVALTTFSDLVGEARERVRRDAAAAGLPDDATPLAEGGTGAQGYADAVATYLAFAVDRAADRGSTVCSWDSSPKMEALRNTFARQAIPMTWDFAEGNPFSESSGNWMNNIEWTATVADQLQPSVCGRACQGDTSGGAMPVEAALVSTDPPYYDNIGYADLSDFFYVWLRRSLRDVFPEVFATLLVPKAEELVATPYRFGGSRQKAQEFFEEGLHRAFAGMRRVQLPAFPMTVYYAFKQAEGDVSEKGAGAVVSTGWETMLNGLIEAGFAIRGTWPMRSELSNRMVASGANALASSIVLVCRPRPEDAPSASRAEFLDELGAAMREALPLLASGKVAPVDLAQASIGPGMAVYSKYHAVIRQDGRRVSVREALQDINSAIAAYRAERVSSFDPETRFCLAWYEQFGYGAGKYGDADTLARAYNVAPNAMQREGLLAAERGELRLERPASYPVGVGGLLIRTPGGSAWEACLRLAVTLEKEGERGAALLARELGDGAAGRARELAVWLYTLADQKRRTEDAYLFNALEASWAGIQEQLARLSAGGEQASFP